MWRNQIYTIVINAFRNMAEIAPQLHQLGYKDKVRGGGAFRNIAPQLQLSNRSARGKDNMHRALGSSVGYK